MLPRVQQRRPRVQRAGNGRNSGVCAGATLRRCHATPRGMKRSTMKMKSFVWRHIGIYSGCRQERAVVAARKWNIFGMRQQAGAAARALRRARRRQKKPQDENKN